MLTQLSGRTIAGRFDLLALLGSGGMGAVYRAHDRELDDVVALKVMRTAHAHRPEAIARFRNEVKLARRVTHRNVARTFEIGHDAELVYCTMELVPGHSLGSLLAHRAPLQQSEAVTITHALCEALSAAHAVGVIHRDIKPDNVLLGDDGRVVLADFGVAALSGEALDVAGTPPYMAPEQLRGEPPTPASDIYAVGCLLYEMLSGKRAFDGPTDRIRVEKERLLHLTLPDGFAPELGVAVQLATMRDKSARIASASELGRHVVPRTAHTVTPIKPSRAGDEAATFELRTIIVLPPRADEPVRHIAAGVHESMLARLADLPRVRVRPRTTVEPNHGANLVVRLQAAEDLEVTITRHDGREATLRVPLSIGEIDAAAAASVRAIELALSDARPADAEAIELYLRARQMIGLNSYGDHLLRARTMLEQAAKLRPDDPKIIATLASATIRHAFQPEYVSDEEFTRATELVRRALALGPTVVDAHLAAAHLALTRDAPTAARHFRRAIACAPYSGEAHALLGRMLLEAGFIQLGEARLEEAIAMAPALAEGRWERARAWYLEGRRADAWREVEALLAIGSTRVMVVVRMAWWDRDHEKSAFWRAELDRAGIAFDPLTQPALFAAVHDGAWPTVRDMLMSSVLRKAHTRRTSLTAQVVAEVAGLAGDRESCMEAVEHAIDAGLFDRHWLERCPLLDDIRTLPRYARIHDIVRGRADLVLGALYGDETPDAAEPTATRVL